MKVMYLAINVMSFATISSVFVNRQGELQMHGGIEIIPETSVLDSQ